MKPKSLSESLHCSEERLVIVISKRVCLKVINAKERRKTGKKVKRYVWMGRGLLI